MSNSPFDRFKALLQDIFQFETGDLDFGIYRILNAKRKQIESFIETDLQAVVDQAFGEYAAAKSESASAGVEAAKAKVLAVLGDDAFNADGQLSLTYQNTNVAKEYVREVSAASTATATDTLKNKVYNDLLTFFARYYDDGDFLPLRRAGRENTYHIPYNGEEVVLHWANKGQYYIKTDDRLAAYRFKAGSYHVSLEVRSAQTELNNNKGAKRFYLLADGDADGYAVDYDADSATLHVFFAQRPLTADEELRYTGNSKQDAINKATSETVLARVTEIGLKNALSLPYKVKDGETAPKDAPATLLRHLTQFTKKNAADFFIHKNLGAFLTAELDGFIKSECLELDELLHVSDADFALQRARARATKQVGDKIIALLASVEDFQKRLFEKRKFVTRTEYVFTLDRVPSSLHAQVLANAAQVQEWESLYGVSEMRAGDGLLGLSLAPSFSLPPAPSLIGMREGEEERDNRLPVDTRHFDADFKAELLASVDDLDALTDGVLFNSENFQALNLMTETYRERVKCIYIDPPYNTGGDGFLYKDAYQHSSWMSMMQDRLFKGKSILSDDGAIFASIDDGEQSNLRTVFEQVFGPHNFVSNIIWQKKYAPQNDAKWFSDDHDFLLTFAKNKQAWRPQKLSRSEEQNAAYRNPDSDHRGDWKPGDMSVKTYSDKYDYSITTPSGRVVNPPTGRCWNTSKERFDELVADNRIWFGVNGDSVPSTKRFLSEVGGIVPRTMWMYADVGHNQDGVQLLRDMLPEHGFTSPKPPTLLRRVAEINPANWMLDFFAGSGTTGHAIINLNRDAEREKTGERRRYILCEMGEYFDTVLLPRLKKATFASQWSDGKPTSRDAISHTIKYHFLEQYEDTLNNLRLRPDDESQKVMDTFGEDYLLRYLLDFDTAGSPSLLNVELLADPFRYALRVKDGDDFRNQTVDLPETFSYLLGLQVRKVRRFRDGDREYRAVWGTDRQSKSVAHIWRKSSDLTGDADALKRDAAFVTDTVLPALSPREADRLYINGAFAGIARAENCEPELYRLMYAPVGA